MNIPDGIVYVSDVDHFQYSRKEHGESFKYLDESNSIIQDKKLLKRIEDLVIPPQWQKVKICAKPNGHVQAFGYDEKGRKQYIYHPLWNEYRQKNKFAQLLPFAKVLPKIRQGVSKDLKVKGWPKTKVLALTVSLLDSHYLRIGNLNYQKRNNTFGLTTLRRKHLEEDGDGLKISYQAKSGKYRNIAVKNRTLVRLIKETSDLPGYEVFRYLDEQGKSQKIDSDDVNEYLKSLSKESFTAKVFRTWGGSRMAIEYLDEAKEEVRANPRKKLETALVRKVAKKLGNNISTCRDYYIHPKVLELLVEEKVGDFEKSESAKHEYLDEAESILFKILENCD